MDTLRISTCGDFVAFLPFHIGFTLNRCIVVAAVDGTSLGCVQRVDSSPDPATVAACVEEMLVSARTQGADKVVVVHFDPPVDDVEYVARAAAQAGIPLSAHVHVRDGAWSHAGSQEWHQVPEPWQVPAATALVAEGRAPLAGREQLAAAVAHVGPTSRLAAAHSAWGRSRERLPSERRARVELQAWAAVVSRGWQDMPDDVVVRAWWGLSDHDVRDTLLLHLVSPNSRDAVVDGDAELARACEEALTADGQASVEAMARGAVGLARVTPRPLCADAYAVAAALSWRAGQGATARMCLEEAHQADRHHRLTSLLGRFVDAGHPLPA